MPDRLPPHWGHEPEDGRDLDALLSVEEILTDEALLAGQLAGISDSQRPVAGAMFALRAAPAGSELAGEAAARAAFRALIEPAGAELHQTLVLSVPAAGHGPRPPARHRHRRRAAGDRRGWHVVALAGSAAAVVAVGAALAGTFGFAGHGGQSANPSAAHLSPSASPSAPGTQQSLLGRGQATKDANPSATPKASATPGAPPSHGVSPVYGELCRQFFEDAFPPSPGNREKEKELFDELSRIVGSKSPRKIGNYCAQQVGSWWVTQEATASWRGVPFSGGGAKNWSRADGHAGKTGAGKASPAPSSSQRGGGSGGSGSGSGGSQ